MPKPERRQIGPTDYNDHEGIKQYLTSVEESERGYQDQRRRQVLYHCLFYDGQQWIDYDRSLQAYRPLAMKPTTPKPVTNKFAVGVDSLVSSLVGYNPEMGFHPASEEAEDVAAANVADQVLEIIKHETNDRLLQQLESKWVVLTGDCFRVTNYGPDLLGPMTFVQHERCQMCLSVTDPKTLVESEGQCPQCQQQGPYMPAVDEQQEPIGDTVPRGRMSVELHSRLTLSAASAAVTLDESPYVVIDERKPVEWVERTYGQKVADTVETDVSSSDAHWIMNALAHSTTYSLLTGPGNEPSPSVRLRRLWLRPTPTFPGGLYAEVLGETVVDSRPWAYHDREGRPILNITHTPFDRVPGRLWGKTRVSDAAEKQVQRNKVEAVMQLIERRTSTSHMLVPRGSGVSRLRGEPGFIINYNALAGVPPPTRMEGSPPLPYWIQRIQMIDNEMDALFGSFEIGRGEAPKGVSSYAGMQLLDERSRQAKSSVLMNWGLGREAWAKRCLDIWREHAEDERSLATGEGSWAVQKFTKADLRGGVDVTVDLGLNRPYTQIGRRAALEQAIRLGLASPYDPAERFRSLQLLGVPEIMADYKREKADASRENDLMIQGMPIRPPLQWENHPVHLETHKRILTGERFEALPPEVQQAAIMHSQQHYQNMQMQVAPPGPGQIAPGPNQGQGGTAKENEGGEQEQLDQEAQMASPDDFSGGGGQPMMAGMMG